MLTNTSDESAKTRGRTLDHAAGLYDLLAPIMSLGRDTYYFRRTIKEIKLEPGNKILDVGCATGHFSEMVCPLLDANKGGSITAIDAASKMIEKARKKNLGSTASFDIVAAERLPYAEDFFDKATSLFFFHHVDFELKVAALNEIYRTLKPGGCFVLVDIDKPVNWFGKFVILCGEKLFRQPEIRENRLGLLQKALKESKFGYCEPVQNWYGYVNMYRLIK